MTSFSVSSCGHQAIERVKESFLLRVVQCLITAPALGKRRNWVTRSTDLLGNLGRLYFCLFRNNVEIMRYLRQ